MPTLTPAVAEMVPPEVSERPPLGALIAALMLMSDAAFNVSVPAEAQESGSATVMVPAWVPDEPVDTVTFAADSAVISVLTLITLSSPLAVKPDVSVPLEMTTL